MIVTELMIKEALRYIQMPRSKCDEDLIQKIKHTYDRLSIESIPKYTYQCFGIHCENEEVFIEETNLSIKSKDLVKLFKYCNRCYILASTLGQDVDKQIARKQKTDMLDALILDACASVLVDKVCDNVEAEIIEKLQENEFLTMRFSPGYGDVPLEIQPALLDMLSTAKKIGLTLTKTHMLLPTKSVTAFVGISNQKENREKSCGSCNLVKTCKYRERGDKCGI